MILRRIFNHVRLDDIHIHLAECNNLIKLNSLVHSQMKSKAFESMIKYAWHRSRYLKTDPGPFQNVKDVCFTLEKDKCCVENCINGQIIRCSWCQQELCFVHFSCKRPLSLDSSEYLLLNNHLISIAFF